MSSAINSPRIDLALRAAADIGDITLLLSDKELAPAVVQMIQQRQHLLANAIYSLLNDEAEPSLLELRAQMYPDEVGEKQ